MTRLEEIVAALRAAGASVECTHAAGNGFPNLVCGYFVDGFLGITRRTILMEVKTATGKLTPDQVEWHAAWRGQVAIVRSVEEALELIGR